MFIDDKKQGEAQIGLEPWRQVLLDAADILDRDGWCQHTMSMPNGSRCVMGAVGAVGVIGSRSHYHTAFDKLLRSLSTTAIAGWNDKPGQTKEAVTAHLRKLAMQES